MIPSRVSPKEGYQRLFDHGFCFFTREDEDDVQTNRSMFRNGHALLDFLNAKLKLDPNNMIDMDPKKPCSIGSMIQFRDGVLYHHIQPLQRDQILAYGIFNFNWPSSLLPPVYEELFKEMHTRVYGQLDFVMIDTATKSQRGAYRTMPARLLSHLLLFSWLLLLKDIQKETGISRIRIVNAYDLYEKKDMERTQFLQTSTNNNNNICQLNKNQDTMEQRVVLVREFVCHIDLLDPAHTRYISQSPSVLTLSQYDPDDPETIVTVQISNFVDRNHKQIWDVVSTQNVTPCVICPLSLINVHTYNLQLRLKDPRAIQWVAARRTASIGISLLEHRHLTLLKFIQRPSTSALQILEAVFMVIYTLQACRATLPLFCYQHPTVENIFMVHSTSMQWQSFQFRSSCCYFISPSRLLPVLDSNFVTGKSNHDEEKIFLLSLQPYVPFVTDLLMSNKNVLTHKVFCPLILKQHNNNVGQKWKF
jgi:hypothetical protein